MADVDPRRWEALKRVFERALSLSPADRAAYLDALGGAQAEFRAEVEALLAAHAVQAAGEPESGSLEGPGTVIGHYKLLEEIGSGGFGTVYMAQQTEPVSRRVALKIIKPGMDTREVLARFEAEQQALALMEHENIARVFDGGITQAGRPYFVMELVRGIPITEYCDARRLGMRARLELFRKVCLAVEHAHEKGVVHRDIKPSNVLVTERDGEPVPKVIDFGVAKAIGRELTQKTLFTGFRALIGTPEYMSPEQTNLSGVQVDRRSDVYSLGVLLYELLTSTRPFRIAEVLERGFEDLMRTIREEDPPKPSTRLGTLGGELDTAAARRMTSASDLRRSVRGELDWLTMKCLEKDRARRYPTAKALAEDVGRHLADEPVEAGPPGLLYRGRKFAKRQRAKLQLGGLALVCLTAVFGVVARFRARADVARAELQHELETRVVDEGVERDRMTALLSKVLTGGELGTDDREQASRLLEHWAERVSAGMVSNEDLEMLARLVSDIRVDGRSIATTEAGANLRIVVSHRKALWLPGIALAYSVHPQLDAREVDLGARSVEVYGAYGGGGSTDFLVPSPSTLGDHVLAGAVEVHFVHARPLENPYESWPHGTDHPYCRDYRLGERDVLVRCRIDLPAFRFSLSDALASVVRAISDPGLAAVTEKRILVQQVRFDPEAADRLRMENGAWSVLIQFDEQAIPLAFELHLEDAQGRSLASGDLVVDREGRVHGNLGYDGVSRNDGRPQACDFHLEPNPALDSPPGEFTNPVRVIFRSSQRVALAARPPITEYLEFQSTRTIEAE